jgi:hypothetical protein
MCISPSSISSVLPFQEHGKIALPHILHFRCVLDLTSEMWVEVMKVISRLKNLRASAWFSGSTFSVFAVEVILRACVNAKVLKHSGLLCYYMESTCFGTFAHICSQFCISENFCCVMSVRTEGYSLVHHTSWM